MIRIRGLTYALSSGRKILDEVDLILPDSGLILLDGDSGSGKTTLLNCIGGLDDFEGTIEYPGGVLVRGYQARRIDPYRACHIGYLMQTPIFDERLSLVANMQVRLSLAGVSPQEKTEEIHSVLERVGLGIYSLRLAGDLSTGQKQRFGLAMALVVEPDLLLADEPTANLDTDTASTIASILREEAEKRLIVCSSHDDDSFDRIADAIYSIRSGKIECIGERHVSYADSGTDNPDGFPSEKSTRFDGARRILRYAECPKPSHSWVRRIILIFLGLLCSLAVNIVYGVDNNLSEDGDIYRIPGAVYGEGADEGSGVMSPSVQMEMYERIEETGALGTVRPSFDISGGYGFSFGEEMSSSRMVAIADGTLSGIEIDPGEVRISTGLYDYLVENYRPLTTAGDRALYESTFTLPVGGFDTRFTISERLVDDPSLTCYVDLYGDVDYLVETALYAGSDSDILSLLTGSIVEYVADGSPINNAFDVSRPLFERLMEARGVEISSVRQAIEYRDPITGDITVTGYVRRVLCSFGDLTFTMREGSTEDDGYRIYLEIENESLGYASQYNFLRYVLQSVFFTDSIASYTYPFPDYARIVSTSSPVFMSGRSDLDASALPDAEIVSLGYGGDFTIRIYMREDLYELFERVDPGDLHTWYAIDVIGTYGCTDNAPIFAIEGSPETRFALYIRDWDPGEHSRQVLLPFIYSVDVDRTISYLGENYPEFLAVTPELYISDNVYDGYVVAIFIPVICILSLVLIIAIAAFVIGAYRSDKDRISRQRIEGFRRWHLVMRMSIGELVESFVFFLLPYLIVTVAETGTYILLTPIWLVVTLPIAVILLSVGIASLFSLLTMRKPPRLLAAERYR